MSKPTSVNPLVGSYSGGPKCIGTGGTQARGVWFLGGTSDGSTVTRTCTAPARTPLFFPIVNTFCGDVKGTGSEEEFRQCAHDSLHQILEGSTMFATLDDNPVSGQRADSPLFTLILPKDNILGAPQGAYDAVADGVWVSLPPLSKGEHTIHFGGDFPNAGFKQDNTYKLTVN